MTPSELFASDTYPEDSMDGAFGKRFFDKAVLSKVKGVARYKLWGSFILLVSLTIFLEVGTSQRVANFSPKPIVTTNSQETLKEEDGKILVPEFIYKIERPRRLGFSSNFRANPIEVLDFTGGQTIPPGAEAKAELLTGATNGLIKARLTEPVKIEGRSLLDAGVLLLGQGRSSEERLYVNFNKAVFPSGKFIPISAQAYDAKDLVVGLKGSRVGDIGLKVAASSGLHFLSGLAAGLQAPKVDSHGQPVRPSTGDAALNGVAKASSEQARAFMEDIKGKAPRIEVSKGTVFLLTFDGGDL